MFDFNLPSNWNIFSKLIFIVVVLYNSVGQKIGTLDNCLAPFLIFWFLIRYPWWPKNATLETDQGLKWKLVKSTVPSKSHRSKTDTSNVGSVKVNPTGGDLEAVYATQGVDQGLKLKLWALSVLFMSFGSIFRLLRPCTLSDLKIS